MTTNIHCTHGITVDSPGNNDRAIVHCERADGTYVDVHFDITLDVARVRYAVVDDDETVLFPDKGITAPAMEELANETEYTVSAN